MLHFPNPGSTIENFVSIYRAAFEKLNGRIVDLHALIDVAVKANLATSSGYMGEEAVARSTRRDISRNQLYNSLKMYAELFRMLGWLHPTPKRALNYTFTLLGEQVVAAGRDFWPLLEECVLGIAFPMPALRVKGGFNLRPFAFILRTALACDGHLSRDEMIFGPLSAPGDRKPADLAAVVERIRAARESETATAAAMRAVLEKRDIKLETLGNYTRWPIAVLRDSGWMRNGTAAYRNNGAYQTWFLTEKGRTMAERASVSVDLRVPDVKGLAPAERAALAVVAHFGMMERSGFDIAPVDRRIADARAEAAPVLRRLGSNGADLLFSPFQCLPPAEIAEILPMREIAARREIPAQGNLFLHAQTPEGRDDRSHLFVHPTLVATKEDAPHGPPSLRAELRGLLDAHGSLISASSAFAASHAQDTQSVFYPLVTHLFQILGFRSDYSRKGVHYQRWDACVWVGEYALPVEIKSPTEESVLSTKAVRQALENKVILLARGGLKTSRELTSLIVGYRLPNTRGDMSTLIDDVFKAFGLRLGVIDLTTLARLALRALRDGKTIDGAVLSRLLGFLGDV